MGTFADYNGLQGTALFPMPPISNAPNEAANAPFPGISLDTSTGLNFGPETMGGIGLSEQPPPPAGVPLGQPPDVAGPALMSAPPARPGRGFAGAFGDAATAFGLGLQGRNPMEAMNARAEIERRQRQTQLAEHTEFMKAIDFGVQKLQSLSGEDRANFLVTYGRQLDELKPGLSETMKAMAKRPDISALLGKYGDADVVKAHLALDPSGRSFREALTKPEFHKQVEAQLDQKALPIVGRKLDLMRQRWQQFTPPEKVKEYMADGVLDATELMKINAELENHPEEKYRALALSPAEMQVWERQHEGISKSLGIVSPDAAARIREKALGRDPDAGAKILIDGAGNPWIVKPDGTGKPLNTGAAPATQPTATPPAAAPGTAVTPPGGMQVSPEVQAQRDAEAAAIRQRETQPNGGGAIPTAAVVDGSAAPPAAPQFVPKVNARTQKLELSPAELSSAGAQIAAGQPVAQVIAGYGASVADARNKARNAAISQIKTETGMTDAQAGEELSRRAIDRVAGGKSLGQLTTMLSTNRQAVDQLDFNVKKVSEEMAKLPSSDLSPIINAIYRGEEKWTGDPAYSSLYFYMHAAAQESARILSGGTASVAQLHAGAQAEAQKWANINMTPKVWNEGVAPAMLAEGKERLKTYERAISAQRGGSNSGAAGRRASDSAGLPSASAIDAEIARRKAAGG